VYTGAAGEDVGFVVVTSKFKLGSSCLFLNK
jgi:hypothetical protein